METYKQEPRDFCSPFCSRGLSSTFGRAACCGTLVTVAPWAAVGHISSVGSMCPNHGLLWKMEHVCSPVSPFDLTWLCPGTCLTAVGRCGWNEVMPWTFLFAVYCMRSLEQWKVLYEPWWCKDKMADFGPVICQLNCPPRQESWTVLLWSVGLEEFQ